MKEQALVLVSFIVAQRALKPEAVCLSVKSDKILLLALLVKKMFLHLRYNARLRWVETLNAGNQIK